MERIRVLLLEDSAFDVELVFGVLAEAPFIFDHVHVEDREGFLHALSTQTFDVILSDYALPTFDGISALKISQELCPQVPFIFVSGTLGEELAIEMLKQGATDYVLKQNLQRLPSAVERAIREARDRKEHRDHQEALRRSEERFRLLVESLQDYSIFMLDMEGNITSWNSGAERILLYKEPEIIGCHFSILFTEEDRAKGVPEKELRDAATKGVAEDERSHLRADGTAIWVSGVLRPLFENNGEHCGYAKVMRDITERRIQSKERRLLLKQVEQDRERLNNIIESVPGIVWEFSRSDTSGNGKILFLSEYLEELIGYKPEEVTEEVFWEKIIHPEDRIQLETQLEALFIHGEGSIENRWVDKAGRVLWVETRAVVYHDEHNNVVGLRGVTMDITSRKQQEEERERLYQLEQRALTKAQRNEERYRLLAETVPHIVWVTSHNNEIEYYNQRWYDYTGQTAEEANKNGWATAIHSEDLAILNKQWEVASTRDEIFESECRLLRADGMYRWHLIRALPVHRDGKIVQWIGTSTDIDDQKRAVESLKFLAEASSVLASSLDYQTTLSSVARLAVPDIADWCAVDIVTENGTIRRLAVAHSDPEKVKWAHELERRFPMDPNAPTGVPNVIRTGQSEFFPEITEEMILAAVKDEEQLEIIRQIGFTSVMTVPMVARGLSLGAITLVSTESRRQFTQQDLALAEDLARRAAIAVDNAWLYLKSQDEIAERKKVEEVLRISETRFRTMIEQSPLGIQIFDLQGFCIQANNAWEELWSASREDLADYNIRQDPQLTASGMISYVERAYAGEAVAMPPIHYDPAEIGRLGRARWVRVFLYPVKNQAGEIQEIAIILEDITERVLAEEQLLMAKDEAEAANQAKDRFIAILSHELRTPLTPVMATVEALQLEEDFPSEYLPWLEIVHRNVELEARLIDDLLDLTRIARGKMQLQVEKLDLHDTLARVLSMYKDEFEAKGLQIERVFQANSAWIDGDAARMQQVMWNLVKNAVKFTPPGGKITISTENTNDGLLRLHIADTGIGIEPEILPRIFNAFEQGEQTITRHFGGLGLGLAISKTLVELHNGTITAFSEGRNKGAVFVVEFATASAEGNKTNREQRIMGSTQQGEKTSILLVDDHPDTNLALKMLLERRGYKVLTANTVESALKVARDAEFDLVISDIGLPDASGLDLIRELQQMKPTRAIALSGFGTEDDIQRSKNAGFDEHLTKPFNLQKLNEVIERLLKE